MKEVKSGAFAEKTLVVNGENTAVAAGSGSLPVLGTPYMIALMENATCGETITARAEIREVRGRKIVFSVEATNERGERIGGGTIERFAVIREKFMAKLG